MGKWDWILPLGILGAVVVGGYYLLTKVGGIDLSGLLAGLKIPSARLEVTMPPAEAAKRFAEIYPERIPFPSEERGKFVYETERGFTEIFGFKVPVPVKRLTYEPEWEKIPRTHVTYAPPWGYYRNGVFIPAMPKSELVSVRTQEAMATSDALRRGLR